MLKQSEIVHKYDVITVVMVTMAIHHGQHSTFFTQKQVRYTHFL